MQNIPSVDLRDFLSGNPERKQKFVNEIGKAFEEIGFVENLPPKFLKRVFEAERDFHQIDPRIGWRLEREPKHPAP